MFQNRHCRFVKVADQAGSRADVESVVERQFLAVEFFKMLLEVAVERGFLMRILAVTQMSNERHHQ